MLNIFRHSYIHIYMLYTNKRVCIVHFLTIIHRNYLLNFVDGVDDDDKDDNNED